MKTFKFLHRWLGITAALFILLFAISGIILNHRTLFSTVDINRKYLPKTYHYKNWNFSSVKSAQVIGNDSILLYGNIGIWLADSTLTHFTQFTSGLKKGADNQRTARIIQTQSGNILAGTMSGLFKLEEDIWTPVPLPVKEMRITGITQNDGTIYVLTRSHLIQLTDNDFEAVVIPLPLPSDYRKETSLFKALWVLHSGAILGLPGKIFIDILGLIMIFLSLTGIIWFVAPDVMKKIKKRNATRKFFVRLNRFSWKWHNTLGIWTLLFLIVLTLTGMFLRPPLLIPIVNKSFPAIKNTLLDHPNPWHDKLRDIQFNLQTNDFLISTSEGFYMADKNFSQSLLRVPHQPPVSIMGINVFEQPYDGVFLVGSFSGIYLWEPSSFQVYNYITGLKVPPMRGMANPFGSIPVAGYIKMENNQEFIFDYNAGIFTLQPHVIPPAMPQQIISQSRMSLWNLGLEVHTARFYSFFLGDYYILVIPVAGLVILIILVSGGILWFRNRKRQSRSNNQTRQEPQIKQLKNKPLKELCDDTEIYTRAGGEG